jgi:hypothetical protein
MFSLEIKGMVRACHPPTPMVGLHRQSRDPKLTNMYYEEERKKRDLVCFPRMLRQMTENMTRYRLKRRLWIKALQKFLYGNYYIPYIIANVLEYLSEKREKLWPPLYFSQHMFKDTDTLNPYIRFTQLAGRLVSLGFPERDIPRPDYERYACMFMCDFLDQEKAGKLYVTLRQQKRSEPWNIVFSYFPRGYRRVKQGYTTTQWTEIVSKDKLLNLFKVFQRINDLTEDEISYMYSWLYLMKHPSI